MNNLENSSRYDRIPRMWYVLTLSLMFAVAATIVVAVGAAGNAAIFGEWAPGKGPSSDASGGIRVADPSDRTARNVSDMAQRVGGSPQAALSSLTLLRSGLGEGNVSLLSFSPAEGALCVVVGDRSIACPTAQTTGTPDVLWIVDGGYSRDVEGSPGYAPPALAGLVGSSVESLALVSNGKSDPLELANGAFFAELSFPSRAAEITFEIKYKDGSTKSEVLSSPEN